MSQPVTISKLTPDILIKRVVSDRFIDSIHHLIELEIIKNQREFLIKTNENPSELSKIANPENKRYVDVDMIYKAVNMFGLNANKIFLEKGIESEKFQIEGFTINSNVSGNNNQVNNGKNNTVINGDHHGDTYTAEKIISGLPEKEKKEMKAYFSKAATEMEDLKKTIVQYKKESKVKDKQITESSVQYKKDLQVKDDQIIEITNKYIKLLESNTKVKKG